MALSVYTGPSNVGSVPEPSIELAHKSYPPVLEDVSTHGVFRRRTKDALNTLHQYEALEQDYTWFRYSGLALPCLSASLLISVALLVLTLWHATPATGYTLLSGFVDGVPRKIEEIGDFAEGNLKQSNFTLKQVAAGLILPALAIIFLVWGFTPKPHEQQIPPPNHLDKDPAGWTRPRIIKAVIYIVCALLIYGGAVLAIVAFSSEINTVDDSVDCFQFSNAADAHCHENKSVAITAALFAFVTALLAFFVATFVVFCLALRDLDRAPGWAKTAPEFEGYNADEKYVRPRLPFYDNESVYSFMTIFQLLLAATTTVMLILSVLQNYDGTWVQKWDSSANAFVPQAIETPGWPRENSQLRLSVAMTAVLVILFNFLPFTDRNLNKVIAFLLFATGVVSIVAAGLDIREVDRARSRSCPEGYNCQNDTFVATIFLDFALFAFLVVYVLHEFVFRFKSPHSGRDSTLLERSKMAALDPRRPVQCAVTGEVMTAKQFVYIHRWNAVDADYGDKKED